MTTPRRERFPGHGSKSREVARRTSDELPPVVTEDGSEFRTWKEVGGHYGHPVHRMMARLGSFPPALARYLILGYSKPGELVLDPFCGKGTTLVEAIVARRVAIGCDVAPDAVIVSRAKVSGVSATGVSRYIDQLARGVASEGGSVEDVPAEVRVFYHPRTLVQLLNVRDILVRRARGSRRAQFLLGCLLGILHGKSSVSLSLPSAHAYAMAPGYVKKYAGEHGLTAPERDVAECLRTKALACISDDELPRGNARAYVSLAQKYSFERCGSLDGLVDLVVTSPPYLNAQTYAKDAWLRLWLLDRDYRDLRPRFIETRSVVKYRERMSPCLKEMLRVLKPGGHAFLVAGDATTRENAQPVVARTAEILADVAEGLSEGAFKFKVIEIIDDYVLSHSRYLFPVHRNGASGASLEPKQERVLHLMKVADRSRHSRGA